MTVVLQLRSQLRHAQRHIVWGLWLVEQLRGTHLGPYFLNLGFSIEEPVRKPECKAHLGKQAPR